MSFLQNTAVLYELRRNAEEQFKSDGKSRWPNLSIEGKREANVDVKLPLTSGFVRNVGGVANTRSGGPVV